MNNKIESWEKRFEKEFGGLGRYLCQYDKRLEGWSSNHEDVKGFIRQLLEEQKQEIEYGDILGEVNCAQKVTALKADIEYKIKQALSAQRQELLNKLIVEIFIAKDGILPSRDIWFKFNEIEEIRNKLEKLDN